MLLLIIVVTLALLHPLLRRRTDLRQALLEHLSVVTRRGLPLGPALLALAQERQDAGSRREGHLLRGLAERAEATGSLGAALESAPRHFPRPLCEEVHRAERTGTLADVLELHLTECQRAEVSRLALVERCAYPLMLVPLVVGAGSFLELALYPKMAEIAHSVRLSWSAAWASWGNLGLEVLACAALVALLPGAAGRRAGHRLVSRAAGALLASLPLVGGAVRRRQHAAWMARAAAVLRAGGTLGEALDAGAAHVTTGWRALQRARALVGAGAPVEEVLAAALGRDAEALLPELLLYARAHGHAPGGGLADGLSRCAERGAERAGRRLEVIAEALRPLPVLACGLVVGLHAWCSWELIVSVQRQAVAGWEQALRAPEEVQ